MRCWASPKLRRAPGCGSGTGRVGSLALKCGPLHLKEVKLLEYGLSMGMEATKAETLRNVVAIAGRAARTLQRQGRPITPQLAACMASLAKKGQTWERRDGSRFVINHCMDGHVRYWLSAGSRPQFRSIRIDRLFRYYTLRS
jgi:hypothetical protein